MLRIQQGSHQPDRQTRPPRSTHAPSGNHQRCAEKIVDLQYFTLAILSLESRCKCCFNVGPRQSICQHRQGGDADLSSGLDENEKSHRSAFKFPLIPSGFDQNSINSQGLMQSKIC